MMLSNSPFIFVSVAERFVSVRNTIFFSFTGGHFLSNASLFFSCFLSVPSSLSFWPSLIPKVEWKPFISHQTRFMTAAALHSCWMVCLKGFLTRPWIRLVASHSLFLSAWLDSDADISWTLMHSPDHPTHTCLPLCAARKAAKTAWRCSTSGLPIANTTFRHLWFLESS